MTQVASPGSIGAGLVAGNEKFLVTPSRPARGGRRRKLTPARKRLYLAILSSYDRGLTDHYELASQHKTDRATVRNALAWRRMAENRKKRQTSNGEQPGQE